MEKVHIIIWLSNGNIGGVYVDYEKACQAAEKANKKRSWLQRIYHDMKWIVQTFNVKR